MREGFVKRRASRSAHRLCPRKTNRSRDRKGAITGHHFERSLTVAAPTGFSRLAGIYMNLISHLRIVVDARLAV